LLRFTQQGAQDTTLNASAIYPTGGEGLMNVRSLAEQPDGKWLVGGLGWFYRGASSRERATVLRITTDGALDATFGTGGKTTLDAWPFGASTQNASLAQLTDGSTIVSAPYAAIDGKATGILLVKLGTDGRLDKDFGFGGWTSTKSTGATHTQVIPQPDGKLLVAIDAPGVGNELLRYSERGVLDPGFGLGGRVAFASNGAPLYAALQGNERVLVLVRSADLGYRTTRLLLGGPATLTSLRSDKVVAPLGEQITLTAKVTPEAPNGSIVRFTGDGGVLPCGDIPLVGGVARCEYTPPTIGQHNLRASYIASNLNAPVVSASLEVVQIATPPATGSAIEFYHGLYNHYFVTADPGAAAALDAGLPSGWRRTGITFSVWPAGTLGASDVCRFWTGASFAPISSHFYTPYPAECANVRANSDWTYEGTAFGLQLSEATGNCAVGTTPLFRYYNDGQGGAPNHRYIASLDVRTDMTARGWIGEGNGPQITFACVPNAAQ